MLGIVPYAALDITLFELMKERLSDHHHGSPPPPLLLLAGMLSSTTGQTLAYPLGLIRTRLAVSAASFRLYDRLTDAPFTPVCISQMAWYGQAA